MEKKYHLLDENGKEYESSIPGTLGGHRKLKIYGRLDCPSATRYIAKGQYVQYRVFFADEETAIKAGYRPCAKCMPKEYKEWKQKNEAIQEIRKVKDMFGGYEGVKTAKENKLISFIKRGR